MEAYLPLWRRACDEARSRGLYGTEPFRLDFWGKIFVWVLEPPPKFRFATTKNFQPIRALWEDPLSAFLVSQDAVHRLLAEAKDLPLNRMKITSPFDRRVRYSLWSSFCANAAHHRRHLWQAERVAAALNR
jgi:hypothetical protein